MTEGSVRVCLVAPKPPPYGGIGHWTQMICRYAAGREDVTLDLVNTAPRWRAVDDLNVGKRLLGGSLQWVRDSVQVLRRLRRRPDVVHLTTSGQFAVFRDLAVMCMARLANVPVVYHIRFGRVPELAHGASWEWRLISKAMKMAHTVITIDACTGQTIAEHLPDVTVAKVPNCIDIDDLPQPRAEGSQSRSAVFVGWVIPTKGVEELVRAWSAIGAEGWRLDIVGPGNTDYQRDLVLRYQPEGMRFVGEMGHHDAMRHVASADLFVLPSYSEGFPNAVLEAMALGKPIVASRVGAIPEMLCDGAGLLVEPRDADGLKRALEVAMKDDGLRKHMGSQASERARRLYSLHGVFDQYMAIWRHAARF